MKRVTAVYREHLKESVDSRQNVNAHVSKPKIGVTRHIYIASTDREAEQVACESYRVFYDNIQKLWRDFNTVVLAFPLEHETYHQAGASFSGTVSSVRDEWYAMLGEFEGRHPGADTDLEPPAA